MNDVLAPPLIEMDIELSRWDDRRVALRFPFSRSIEFESVKNAVRETPGRFFHGAPDWCWSVPIDNIWRIARILRGMGCRLLIDDEFGEELARLKAAVDVIPDIIFREDIEEWVQPERLSASLRGYQKVGAVALGAIIGGSLEGDPVGSGKTVTCLADMLSRDMIDGANSVLFVTMNSLKWNVRLEIMKQLSLDEKGFDELAVVINGTKEQRVAQWKSDSPIKVAGYEATFIHDWEAVSKNWTKVYADEITKAKSRSTYANKRMQRLHVTHGITGMTATPYETKLEDVYSIMALLRPGLLGTWTQFKDKYLVTDNWGTVLSTHNLDELMEAIGPYVIRRPKERILKELPLKTPEVISFKLSVAEAREYKRIANDFIRWLRERNETTGGATVLVQMLRLRQFLDSPRLLGPDGEVEGTKMSTLRDILEMSEGDKVVVFTQWSTMAKLLHETFPDSYLITGDVKGEERQRIVESFNVDSVPVLFSTDSMAHGFNITGANIVVHYDQLWNPAKMVEQREGRLHRIGQLKPVTAITLVAEGTIEVAMQEVLESRTGEANRVYEGTEEHMVRRIKKERWAKAVFGDGIKALDAELRMEM